MHVVKVFCPNFQALAQAWNLLVDMNQKAVTSKSASNRPSEIHCRQGVKPKVICSGFSNGFMQLNDENATKTWWALWSMPTGFDRQPISALPKRLTLAHFCNRHIAGFQMLNATHNQTHLAGKVFYAVWYMMQDRYSMPATFHRFPYVAICFWQNPDDPSTHRK